jgi:hypothetical protein
MYSSDGASNYKTEGVKEMYNTDPEAAHFLPSGFINEMLRYGEFP